MVRHDEEMFKVHPESMCRDDPVVADMRSRDYWVGDPPSECHPDTNTGVGLVFPAAPMNLDAKLDKIIDLLGDIKRMLK